MQAAIAGAPVLESAVPPLLSRCFARCSAAVISLFSVPPRPWMMQFNQELDRENPALPASPEQRESAKPDPLAAASALRGRPWVKGQSGNPRGRPRRARRAAYIADTVIARQTVPLANKAVELALAGDRVTLRDCLDRISPRRREPPIALDLPKIDSRADLLAALSEIADAVAAGALTVSQGATLTQMLIALRQATF
jgi:hypothetical protein